MGFKEKLEDLKKHIPARVKIIAVSKTRTVEEIKEAYEAGHRDFGENKVQEMVDKYEQLPKDINWHMVGHLQRKKVKYIAPFVRLIHSVDSEKLLREIDKRAVQNDRVIDCLLQIHIAEEETKYGFMPEDALEILESGIIEELKNIKIVGLMGMATNSDDKSKVQHEFQLLEEFFLELQQIIFKDKNYFKELSMGMTNDYRLAIGEGSTMIRIGTLLFGERNYKK